MSDCQDHLVQRMLTPGFYPHPAASVELLETHISRIFLAGDFAYKLKKPVNLGFLDFSTLDQRLHFCREELRLNRRFSPQLYLEVCRVGGRPEQPELGKSPALDYLVKMRRFPCQAQLDRMLQSGQLSSEMIESFADRLADLHQVAAVADDNTEFGTAAEVGAPLRENFSQLAPLLPSGSMVAQLQALEFWSLSACERLGKILQQRKLQGYIRECHGDLHLANMVWWQEQPLLFDCIEFNENLRWIDVINDIAFLAMDLDDRGEEVFGWCFLNAYFQQTGDYQGIELLNFYKVYRALVRAKVACLRLHQSMLDPEKKMEALRLTQSYLDLASNYLQPQQPQLIITHGLSGSGKSTFVRALAPRCAAIRIHSDIERKRLTGLEASAQSHSRPGSGLYSATGTAVTYDRLRQIAEIILRSGVSVLVDATFLKLQQRQQFQQLAKSLALPFRILDFPLPEKELRRRIELRQLQPGQISEATLEILSLQLSQQEPLAFPENAAAIQIHPDTPLTAAVQWLGSG